MVKVGNTLENDPIANRLKQIAEGYSDTLRPVTRQRILVAAGRTSRGAYLSSPFVLTLPKMLAAAAVLVVLALPALHLGQPSVYPGRAGVGADSVVRDLQVTSQDGQVVLTWKDGQKPRRVMRATSRDELAHMSRLPGELVSGERWVDEHSGDAAVVYYLVE